MRRDSILAHCITRAVIDREGGAEAAVEKYGVNSGASKWDAIKLAARVTPKAGRVSGFIVAWAIGMRAAGTDEFSITEYQRYWHENERQAYRLQKEFRDLWPEYETPNELARQLVQWIDEKASKRDVVSMPTQLQVVA